MFSPTLSRRTLIRSSLVAAASLGSDAGAGMGRPFGANPSVAPALDEVSAKVELAHTETVAALCR